jgi:ATP-dependent exoDNAse (exonuclease V) beta subunit
VLRSLEALGATARTKVTAEALSLARAFIDSPRGQEAAKARLNAAAEQESLFEVEYPFVWRDGTDHPVVLSGSMDLVYGDSDGVVVIDFKTDRIVQPERHRFQLSVYRDAAGSIFGVPARAFLWYLRSGQEFVVEGQPDTGLLGTPRQPAGSMD